MTKQITTLQAMQHPTVVATINVLSSMNQRLQDEIDELKALAQTEQEPTYWLIKYQNGSQDFFNSKPDNFHPDFDDIPTSITPLYTAPPQRPWVGLTDEEAQLIYDMGRTPAGMMEMVEAKLKEKNT